MTDDGIVDNVPGSFDAVIWDGGHLIHGVPPKGNMVTFQDYANETFLPDIRRTLRDCARVDIIWDEYRCDSLKALTRLERGTGVRQLVRPFAKIPKIPKGQKTLTSAIAYLSDMVTATAGLSSRERLRFSNTFRHELPLLKHMFGKRSFCYVGPKAWNDLPFALQELTDTCTFKRQLKRHLFTLAYTNCLT